MRVHVCARARARARVCVLGWGCYFLQRELKVFFDIHLSIISKNQIHNTNDIRAGAEYWKKNIIDIILTLEIEPNVHNDCQNGILRFDIGPNVQTESQTVLFYNRRVPEYQNLTVRLLS